MSSLALPLHEDSMAPCLQLACMSPCPAVPHGDSRAGRTHLMAFHGWVHPSSELFPNWLASSDGLRESCRPCCHLPLRDKPKSWPSCKERGTPSQLNPAADLQECRSLLRQLEKLQSQLQSVLSLLYTHTHSFALWWHNMAWAQ